jgi:hypothetical protein
MGTTPGTDGGSPIDANRLASTEKTEVVQEQKTEEGRETAITVKPDKDAEQPEKAHFSNYWVSDGNLVNTHC